jgi:hypothetical protein
LNKKKRNIDQPMFSSGRHTEVLIFNAPLHHVAGGYMLVKVE